MATWKKTRNGRRGAFCEGLEPIQTQEQAQRIVSKSAGMKYSYLCGYCSKWHVKRAARGRKQ